MPKFVNFGAIVADLPIFVELDLTGCCHLKFLVLATMPWLDLKGDQLIILPWNCFLGSEFLFYVMKSVLSWVAFVDRIAEFKQNQIHFFLTLFLNFITLSTETTTIMDHLF